jgi:crotonobetainyl-CoA:carnitine CoA-transferase CaiB-like acyl-CoA transferase
MVLGDLGADVIKVEPPQGSSSRRMGPFLEEAPEPERSLRFFAFNRNKRGIILDLATEAGRGALLRLVERADFLIESAPPGGMAELGLGFDALRRVNPRLVHVAITAFGQDGPHAGFAAGDLTLSAMGGQVALQGDPERPPVRVTVPQAWSHASAEAAVGALTAHARMLRSGDAQFVDVSAQTAVVWSMLHAMVAHAIQGTDFNRSGSDLQLGHITLPLVYQCADGYVVLLPNGPNIAKMMHWFVEDGVVPEEWIEGEDWPTYDRRLILQQHLRYSIDEVMDAERRYARLHTKRELLERGLREGVTIAPVTTVEDVARFRHLEERGYWLPAPLPDGRRVPVPGLFARLTGTPMSVRRWAPRLGEHNDEVLAETSGSPPGRSPLPERQGRAGETAPSQEQPFEGIKVADFSWIGVGPVTAKYLADHGATVVRVETANPPDNLRGSGPFKDGVHGANRSQFFGDFNTSKYSLSLNLKNPAAVAVARRLIAWADVYIESFTPGTVDDLGIGQETARALNPSIIMASTCLMGQSGPAAAFAGYGFHAASIAGFFEVTGWPDLPPDGPWGAYTDTISPRFLASTVMAALDHRRRTGRGQYIDAAQIEMALHFLAPQIIDFNASGRVVSRNGNRSDTMAPHGVYPCDGDDQWCAIAVQSDRQWDGLRGALGDPGWADDGEFRTADGRLRHQEEIDRHLGDWTGGRSAREVMETLQAVGVPAGVVQRSSDLLRDPQLEHRRFFRYLDHPEMGNIPYTGHQFRIRGYDSCPRFPAPLLGQHNEFVMRDILGMTDEEITDALAAGAIA